SFSNERANAQASRAPRTVGQFTSSGTEPAFKKRYPGPPPLHGTIFCLRNTIRLETSTLARPVAGTNSGLLSRDRAEHPTTHCPCLAKTESGSGSTMSVALWTLGCRVYIVLCSDDFKPKCAS